MVHGDLLTLAEYRLEQARECLEISELTMGKSAKTSVNRSYYAIFHSMRAVLALQNFDTSKHSGIIAKFRMDYIKPGLFPADISKLIGDAFTIRNNSDYKDFYVVSKEEATQQLENARLIYGLCRDFVKEKAKEGDGE